MHNCCSCEKKANWRCQKCNVALCSKDKRVHTDDDLEHSLIKAKKLARHSSKIRCLDDLVAKSKALQNCTSEIKFSHELLKMRIAKSRQAALARIDQKKVEYIRLMENLGKDEKAEEEVENLMKALFIYEKSELNNSNTLLLWYQLPFLDEKPRISLSHIEENEHFQKINNIVSIQRRDAPLSLICDNAYHSLYDQMEAKENQIDNELKLNQKREAQYQQNISESRSIYEEVSKCENEYKQLKLDLEDQLHKIANKLNKGSVDSILKGDRLYIPGSNSLESEFKIIHEIIIENIRIIENNQAKLLTLINEHSENEHIAEINYTLSNTTIPHLRESIEPCRSFVAFMRFVMSWISRYKTVRVSNDRQYYFLYTNLNILQGYDLRLWDVKRKNECGFWWLYPLGGDGKEGDGWKNWIRRYPECQYHTFVVKN